MSIRFWIGARLLRGGKHAPSYNRELPQTEPDPGTVNSIGFLMAYVMHPRRQLTRYERTVAKVIAKR